MGPPPVPSLAGGQAAWRPPRRLHPPELLSEAPGRPRRRALDHAEAALVTGRATKPGGNSGTVTPATPRHPQRQGTGRGEGRQEPPAAAGAAAKARAGAARSDGPRQQPSGAGSRGIEHRLLPSPPHAALQFASRTNGLRTFRHSVFVSREGFRLTLQGPSSAYARDRLLGEPPLPRRVLGPQNEGIMIKRKASVAGCSAVLVAGLLWGSVAASDLSRDIARCAAECRQCAAT